MLASHCIICGRPLVDAISVSVGMGPECRQHNDAGISPQVQEACNKLTHDAALAAQNGDIESIYKYADEIERLGLKVLADKVRKRFVNAKKNVKIRIREVNGKLYVKTPFRRNADFITAWREIEGRRYDYANKENVVPIEAKPQVWTLLQRFWPGFYGEGPKGLFRVISPDDEVKM